MRAPRARGAAAHELADSAGSRGEVRSAGPRRPPPPAPTGARLPDLRAAGRARVLDARHAAVDACPPKLEPVADVARRSRRRRRRARRRPGVEDRPIRLKDERERRHRPRRAPASESRHEPESMSAAGAYEPFRTTKDAAADPVEADRRGRRADCRHGRDQVRLHAVRRAGHADGAQGRAGRRARAGPAPPPVAGNAGRLTITTQPPGARVTIDGKAAGETPLTLDTVKPGRHVITLISRQRRVGEADRARRGRPDAHDRRPALLRVRRDLGAVRGRVSENGKALGTSDDQILLSPGTPHPAAGQQGARLRRDRDGGDPAGRGHARRARSARPGQHQRRAVGGSLDRRREGRRDAARERRRSASASARSSSRTRSSPTARSTATITAHAPATISVDFNK